MSLSLASIHVYPIKSLGGYSVAEARLTDRGLEHDRRWMLVDEQGTFVTQRDLPAMACLHCSPQVEGFRVTDIRDGSTVDLPWSLRTGDGQHAVVWNDTVRVEYAHNDVNAWFSKRLARALVLVYMPDSTHRPSEAQYGEGLTSFSDGFPYLIVSQASLDDLNERLPVPIGMERFRPNLVIAGGTPFQEDGWRRIHIGQVRFDLVKPCARCVITTTDQRTGARGKEPLRTLATFRDQRSNVMFGMNAVAELTGRIRIGDPMVLG